MENKSKLIKLFLSVIVLGFTVCSISYAVPESYRKGVNLYLDGSIDPALTELEKAYEEAPENEKVKGLLAEILILKAGRLNENEEYEKALEFIERAKKLRPDDEKVNRVYDLLYSKVHPDEALEQKEIQDNEAEFEESQDLEELKEEEEEKREERVKIIEKPPEKLTVKERELLRPIIMSGESGNDNIVYYVMGGTVVSLILFMIMAGYWLKSLTQTNRESMEEISRASAQKVEKMEKELRKVRREKRQLRKKDKKESRKEKRDRRHREEKLKKEYAQLLKESIQSSNTPREIKEPRISESPADKEEEKRVKSSFRKLRKTKYGASVNLLKKMTKSGNSWVRLWAAELTPDLKIQDQLNILKELVTDPEYQVKKRAVKELKRINNSKKTDKIYRMEANNILNDVQTEGWVV
ncbi:MAG: hypothetical protein ACQEQC_05330 [Elusimicrobiota bacterium]